MGAHLIPNLVYEDAEAAIAWLEKAFGFACNLKVPGTDKGSIVHAQLVAGEVMVMVSSDQGGTEGKEAGSLLRSPISAKVSTQGLYLVVDDVQAAYDRALAAGAGVVRPLKDQEYGGSGFTVSDCEGHPWSFGDYNPWQS